MNTARSSKMRRIGVAGLLAVLCFVLALPADAFQRPKTKAEAVATAKAGGDVTISGWATFSGQQMFAKEDEPKDSTGVDNPTGTGAIGDGSEILSSDFIYRPENEDFFWRLELKKIPVIAPGIAGVSLVGSPTTLYGLKFTIGKEGKAYQIRAARIGSIPNVPPDAANPPDPNDVVNYSFGLFTCTETTCEQIAQLKGGYGTTGERIVVALPLKVLRDEGNDVQEGDTASDFIAFSALSPFQGLVTESQFFDQVRLEPVSTPVPKKSVTVTVGKKSQVLTDGNGLKDGYFDAEFPASLFKKSTTVVKTRTCLGNDCVNQSFKVTK